MSFEEELTEFTKSIPNKIKHIDTEETTKIALILPFLRLLGYDTTNPGEVRAEYTADIGTKKGEKIDIALLDNGNPLIFIECKIAGNELNKEHISQLYRYFSVSDVKIGILTNGVEYKFFTTSDGNKMDEKPFLDLNLTKLNQNDINELKKFIKNNIDIDDVLARADNLKYRSEIKKCLENEFKDPSDEFVKVIAKQCYDGILTKNMRERFKQLIIKVNTDLINEKVDKRLKEAVKNSEIVEEQEIDIIPDNRKENITPEEYDAFYIIRSILSEIIPPERVAMRERKYYCGILLDDNQNYSICRLFFNNLDNLRVMFFDSLEKDEKGRKKGYRINIDKVEDLYRYKDRLIRTVSSYLEIKDN